MLPAKTALYVMCCGEVHPNARVKLNKLNSFYKINIPSLEMISLQVKLLSPPPMVTYFLAAVATEFSMRSAQ